MVADVAKLAVGREEYYTRELAADKAYLSGHGESPGRWYGRGSATLGLEGEASVAGFMRAIGLTAISSSSSSQRYSACSCLKRVDAVAGDQRASRSPMNASRSARVAWISSRPCGSRNAVNWRTRPGSWPRFRRRGSWRLGAARRSG